MKPLDSPLLWCGVLLIAVGIVVAVKLMHGNGEQAEPAVEAEPKAKGFGFQDAVKDPEGWAEQMEDGHRELQRLLDESKNWSDAKLSAVVRHFVFDVRDSRDAFAEQRTLQNLATRVVPIAVRYLGDKTLRERLVTPTGEGVLPETPFLRVCMLLEDNPSAESLTALLPFLDESSPEIRKSAILIVATVGSESVVAPVRKAFADSDEYVRSYAITGLQRAAKGGRLSDACRTELFEDVRSLLTDGKNSNNGVDLLFEFDERRTREWFVSAKCLTPDFPSLYDSLRALNARGIRVPRDLLLTLIDQLAPHTAKHPHSYQLGEVLHALGKHQVAKDRELLERYLTHAEQIVAEGAAEGLVASHGLGDFRKRIWEAIEKDGVRALTPQQRHYHAVTLFDGEVNNGGLSQYFFNSSGDTWRDALEGLEAMGSKERLAVLREALANFGERGPSVDRSERMAQLAKLAREQERPFGDLDSRYYASKEVSEVLAMRYVLKHPEAFR